MLADVNCVLTMIAVGGRGFPNGVRKRERRREEGHGERERRVKARERKANITSTHVCTNTVQITIQINKRSAYCY